jgi:transcriptional regulator GlxA family with amidase domain
MVFRFATLDHGHLRHYEGISAMANDLPAPLLVALLATEATTAATLFGVYDILHGVRRDWEAVIHGRHATSPIRPVIVARDRQPVRGPNAVRIEPQAGFADCPVPDVVCITDMMVLPGEPLDARFAPEAHWVRERYEAGATVAAVCTGAALMAQAGLLDNEDATSHWAYCEALGRQYPATRWLPGKALVTAGVGQRLIMAGSGTSWHALALFLIARFVGAEEAMQAARLNIIEWNTTSPLAYAAMARTSQVSDPPIARCQEWASQHYQTEAPVAEMAKLSGLAERTFQRRFLLATGHTPLDYVHTLRLEEAKQLLEASDLPVESVALEVGYQDTGFFARLFRRKVGLTPAQYRRRFGMLARRLAAVSEASDGTVR